MKNEVIHMDFRNRHLITTIRSLLGLLMVFSGITGLMAGNQDMKSVPEPMVAYSQSLWDMGIFQMIKVTEIVAGLMLLTGFLPALAAILVAPIAVGIIVFNARVSPQYLPMGIIVCIFVAYLGYAYWEKYKALYELS